MKIKVCPVKPVEAIYSLVSILVIGVVIAAFMSNILLLGQITAALLLFGMGWLLATGSADPEKDTSFSTFMLCLTSAMICLFAAIPVAGVTYGWSETWPDPLVIVASSTFLITCIIANAMFYGGYFTHWAKDCIRIVPDDDEKELVSDVMKAREEDKT